MKTKLLVTLGIIMAVLSAVAVAGDLFTSPWSKEIPQVQQAPVENTADDVSALLLSLQGIQAEESAYLDDDNAIYVSRPNDLHEKASRRKVADNVEHIFGQHGSKVLFAKTYESNEEVGWHGDLWILDTQIGKETKVSDSVSAATLSPHGKLIAISNLFTGGIDLLSGEGVFVKKIGLYGVGAVFSPDNKQIAYTKLAKFTNSPFDMVAPGNILGVVIHNIVTSEEATIVSNERDGGPIAFSFDGKKLYFDSSRSSGDASLWVVNLVSHEVNQVTNRGHVSGTVFTDPRIYANPIFSSDEKVIVSTWGENGVGILALDDKGDVLSAKTLANATDPHFIKQDEIIAYRAQGKKGKYWEFVSVK